MEKSLHLARFNEKVYIESINLSCAFIGMLVAKCVDPLVRVEVLEKIAEMIVFYENDHRSNLEDLELMAKNRPPNP